jgi:hypothetical protein
VNSERMAKRLENVVNEILVHRGALRTDQMVRAAHLLGIDLQADLGTARSSSLEERFRVAVAPILVALETKPRIRADRTVVQQAANLVGQLEAIARGEVPAMTEIATLDCFPIQFESARQELLKDFRIAVCGVSQISVDLRKRPRLELLERAQAILKGWAVDQLLLEKWSNDRRFTRPSQRETPLGVCGNVPASTGLTRAQQAKAGWNDVPYQDLAVAHAAYLVATSTDFFGGLIIRAREDALDFAGVGLLDAKYIGDTLGTSSIGASKSFRPR